MDFLWWNKQAFWTHKGVHNGNSKGLTDNVHEYSCVDGALFVLRDARVATNIVSCHFVKQQPASHILKQSLQSVHLVSMRFLKESLEKNHKKNHQEWAMQCAFRSRKWGWKNVPCWNSWSRQWLRLISCSNATQTTYPNVGREVLLVFSDPLHTRLRLSLCVAEDLAGRVQFKFGVHGWRPKLEGF